MMKKSSRRKHANPEHDTMRPEYDFSSAIRGATAGRYAQGANVVVDDFDREAAALGASDKFMAFLAERSKETGDITLEDMRKKLGL